jgi:hypothetical protein
MMDVGGHDWYNEVERFDDGRSQVEAIEHVVNDDEVEATIDLMYVLMDNRVSPINNNAHFDDTKG